MMKKLASALCCLLLPAALLAQNSRTGTVVNKQTGTPIAGAVVSVPGTVAAAVTDSSGAFTVSSTANIGRLAVTAIGFTGQEFVVTSSTAPIRIELVPSTTELPGVRVVATQPTTPAAVLTQHDLQRASGLDLQSSINTIPGVFMQSRTPFGGARITLRGYYPSTSGNSPNSNGLGYTVFLNDIPLTDATGNTILDDVDYSVLGSAEVIKGPASSMYGSAIGGTVRLSTERPTPGQTSLSQQVLGGSDGLLRTNTTFMKAGSNSNIVLNYGHQQYDSFRPHSGSQKEYVEALADLGIGQRQSLSAYFSYNRSFEELAGEIDSTDFYARMPESNPLYLANDSHIQLTSVVAGLTDHYRINQHFSNQTTAFATGRTSGQPFAHGFTDVNQFNLGARTAFDYDTQLSNGVGIKGTLGAFAQRSNLTSNGVFIIPAPPFPERPSAQENFAVHSSLFTEWNFALPSAVTLTVGGSLNKNEFAIRNMLKNNQLFDTTTVADRSFPAVFTPRVALSKAFSSGLSLYGSVSTGYTPPLLSNTVANDGSVDLTLKPERAVQYEVGTRGSLLNDRLSGEIALFDLENTDKLVSETSNSVTFTTNAGKQRNQGVEAALSFLAFERKTGFLSLVRPWASYAYTKATFVDFKSDNNGNANTQDWSGNDVPRVPRNMFTAGLDLASNMGGYLNSSFQHVDKVPVTFDNSTFVRGYNLLGAKVGYRKLVNRNWQLDASVGGDNLLGSTYYSFLFVGPNYNGLAQSQDGGRGDGYIIPAPYDATFYGNLTLKYVF
jgi:iron complex outermembrane receptor protein